MDETAKKLLDLVQGDFPVNSRPYLVLANKLGVREEEVILLIKKLKEEGYIRRIGGLFDSRRLGYISTLCAMKVTEDEIEKTMEIINSYDGVTHNYLRNHAYNMWFTLTASSREVMEIILKEIGERTGNTTLMTLRAKNTFKIKVHLNLEGE